MNKSRQDLITFLLCAESGKFEIQTLMAIECLRRFGGDFANAPILVVTPRMGPSLDPSTLARFRALDVQYIYANTANNCSWYVYMNKALAASIGEQRARTEQLIWLDSDVLVVRDPAPIALSQDEDFACCSLDKNIGSSGPGDRNERYWQALSDEFRFPLDRLPWTETSLDKQRVRFRLHSGVYSFRSGRGLGEMFVKDMETMLTCGIGFARQIPFPGDDVALAFSVSRLGLRWRQLHSSANLEMMPNSKWYSRNDAAEAVVLHYHKALSEEEGCRWFLDELAIVRPDVADWLRSRIPLPTKAGGLRRAAVRRVLHEVRKRRFEKVRRGLRFPAEGCLLSPQLGR